MRATTLPPESSPADVHRSRDLYKSDTTERLRVLFIQHCASRTGSTVSGKLAVAGFRNAGWYVDAVFGFEGPMITEYEGLGCRTHVVPHKSWLRGGGVVRSLRRMLAERRSASAFAKLMRDTLPDVVYVNSLVSLAGALAARRCRLPCIWHIREQFDDVGGEMRIPGCGGRPLVRRLVTRLSTRRVAISQAAAKNVLGTTDESIVDIVPNAVDDQFFDLADDVSKCRQRLGLPVGVPIIGVPGTLRPLKGHPFFLEAAARVACELPECVFAITGTGDARYEASLHEQAERLGIAGQVRFLGMLTDMPRFYRACDVVCVPSQAEAFGRTVIEGFAVGTPVVATAVGGMRETIKDGVTGLLVEYGAVPELHTRLATLLKDDQHRTALVQAASRHVLEQNTAQRYQRRLREIVEHVVAAR